MTYDSFISFIHTEARPRSRCVEDPLVASDCFRHFGRVDVSLMSL